MNVNNNIAVISGFLSYVRPNGLLSLVAMQPDGDLVGKTFESPGEVNEAASWANTLNTNGYNVYWTVNPVSRRVDGKPSKSDIASIEYLQADIDPDMELGDYTTARADVLNGKHKALLANGQAPTFVIDTGNGLGAFWKVEGVPDNNAGEDINRRLIQQYGADPVAWNVDRLMRLPGTLNYPNARKLAKGYPDTPSTAALLDVSANSNPYQYSEMAANLPAFVGTVNTGKDTVDFNEDETPLSTDESITLDERFQQDRDNNLQLQYRWTGITDGLIDVTRSGLDMSLGSMLIIRGYSYREMRHILVACTYGAGAEKADAGDERYFRRIWVNAVGTPPPSVNDDNHIVVSDFNAGELTRAFIESTFKPNYAVWHQSEYHVYQSPGFKAENKEDIYHKIWSVLPRCWDVNSGYYKKATISMVRNVYECGASLINPFNDQGAPFWICGDNRPPANEMLAFENGLLHVITGQWFDPTPEFFTVNVLPYDYQPSTPVPTLWLKFLDEVLPGDTESISALQEMFGYTLLPDTSMQKFFLLIGKRRGGKGTIGRVLAAIIGTHNVAGTTLNSLAGRFGMEKLPGKLLWIISDMRMGRGTDQRIVLEKILSITGEDIIDVERKHIQPWTGRISARLVVMTNVAPQINDPSGALLSRMIPIKFTQTFEGREDASLECKLMQELPGIFNWALDGYKRLQERGRFVVPATALDTMGDIRRSTNPLHGFIEEHCVIGPEKYVGRTELYNLWGNYRHDEEIYGYATQKSFVNLLKENFPEIENTYKTFANNNRVHCYTGIGLKCAGCA